MKYIYFVLVICCLIYESNNSLIKVEDQGYSGIVVGFSRKIKTGQKELLQNLKDLFNEASGVLFNITSQRAYFKEITFLIPDSWDKENLFGPEEQNTVHKVGLERYNEADIFIESESGFFPNNPYTIQIAGCAKQGLGIHFSRTYLEKNRGELHLIARNLIYEWMKYRYGVFDEHGFQGDERYPVLYGIPGNSTYKQVTSCSNRPVDYMETADIRKCTINAKTGRVVDSACTIEIKSEQTDASSSSFMFSSKMMHLCGTAYEYIHDYNSPTKHNALCSEKSISEIISRHKDFINLSSRSVDFTPTFRYVQESHLPLVLAIDNSKDISSRKVDQLLKNVVYRFLEFSIVKGQPVDLVFYNSQNETVLKSFEDNWSFPSTFYTDPGCIKCALRDSMKVLKEHDVIEGSTLVLIVRHTLTDDEIKILHNDFESQNIRVHVILCLVDGLPARPLESEFAETGIRVQYVPMETENTEHFLYGALQSSLRDNTFGTAEDNIMIMQQSFKHSKSFLNFTFPVDESAKREVKILVSPFGLVYEQDHLVSFNNKNYDVKRSVKFSELPNAGLTMLKLPSPETEPGKISVSLRKEEGSVDVVVLAKESSVLSAIIVRCWLSISSQFINVDNHSEPIIFYTEVRSGNFPVRNARVEATLHHPDKSKTSYILTDDGIGDPDITKDDGIYSRYITGFSTKGHYILTVLVTDNEEKTEIITETVRDGRCCGSVIPSVRTVPTGKFSRVYNYGSFYVSLAESGDFYPPSRITDFAVIDIREAIEPWRVYLTFEFSSPGGNYNNDEVSHYNIGYFRSRSLIKDFDHAVIPEDFYIHRRIPSPSRYGEKQNFILEMPEIKLRQLKAPGDMVFFAIQALDDSGNKGEPSNVVEVYLPIPSPSTKSPPLNSTSGSGEDGGNEGEADYQTDDNQKKMTSGQVGMIVGIIIGCIILLVAMAVAAFLFTRRKNTKKPKQNRALPENNKLQKVSNEYLSDDAMKAPVSISDPISPVQSWPANVLMDHYDKIQEAKRKNGSDDSIDSSSGDSSHPLKPNPIYEGGTDDRYRENNRYLPTAPYSSSQSSLNKTPRNVTQV